MPVIAAGTRNPGKIEAVKRALEPYSKLQSYEVQGCAGIESGVSDQPMSLEETTRGAKNRAHRARQAKDAELGIGMESGLFEVDGKLFDICACAIDDGEHLHVGYSCAWELPTKVAELVRSGKDLTQAFNGAELCNDPEIGDKGGVLALMTGNRITRPDYTVQSVQMAVLTLNPECYGCSAGVLPGINAEEGTATAGAAGGGATAARALNATEKEEEANEAGAAGRSEQLQPKPPSSPVPAKGSQPRCSKSNSEEELNDLGGTWRILYHSGNFKGRAEFIRLILEDAGVHYEESAEQLYGPDGFCDAFRGLGSSEKGLGAGAADYVVKDTAPFPVMFPPILHYKPGPNESEVFINQVPAIMRYCAGQLGYLPRGVVQTAMADEIMLNANDLVAEGRACFHPVDNKASYTSQKEEADKASKKFAQDRLPVWLGHFEKVVKKLRPDGDGPILDRVTYADFMLFHALDSAEAQFNSEFYGKAWDLAAVPTLKTWKAWLTSRPKLASYLTSSQRKDWAGDSMM